MKSGFLHVWGDSSYSIVLASTVSNLDRSPSQVYSIPGSNHQLDKGSTKAISKSLITEIAYIISMLCNKKL